MPIIDITGKQFDRLTVLKRTTSDQRGEARWICRCECGNETIVLGSNLRSGKTRSCGCLRFELPQGASHPKHGAYKTREYSSWQHMRRRCLDQNNDKFHRYGGRGITICERWNSFENFLADMGRRPPGLTLDRINNDGNYEPGNCRWATSEEQASNHRMKRGKDGKYTR